MRFNKIYFILMFLIFSGLVVQAQDRNGKKTKKSVKTVLVQIVNGDGHPLSEAKIHSAERRATVNADSKGEMSFQTVDGDVLVIKAEGYITKTLDLSSAELLEGRVVMDKALAFSGENHTLFTPFDSISARRSVGSYSAAKGDGLTSNPTLSFENSLGGRLGGLWQQQTNGTPGWTGQSLSAITPAWGGMVVMVDGVERTLDFLDPEVVESVQLLKDPTFKSMYGGRQANGILLVTTKRGKINENGVKINLQRGVQMPTRLPKYLNSYDYATFYNQALENDGFGPLYSPDALNAYKTGSNPYLYPNVDYYSEFLNKSMEISKISAQMTGGNRDARYFAHIGYQGNGGLEKHAERPISENLVTLRTNVDLNLKDFITLNAGFNGALQIRETSNVSSGDIFNTLSSYRPNEIPLLIPAHLAGVTDREYVFGGTAEKQNNLYGLLSSRGYEKVNAAYIQSDLGLNIDLGQWVKGLSVKPFVTMDVYNVSSEYQAETFAVFEPSMGRSSLDEDSLIFTQWGDYNRDTEQSRRDANVRRNFAYNIKASYLRTFGQHDIKAYLNFYEAKNELRNVHQDPRRQNLGLHVNYMFRNTYVAEVDVNRVGVNTFAPDKRYGIFPAFGLGWILSEEGFMKNLSVVNYLKLRGSYGVLGSTSLFSDGGFSVDLYRDKWLANGSYNSIGGDNNRIVLDRTGNPDLTFQKSYEFSAGVDAQLFAESTFLSVGYFNNYHTGLFTNLSQMISGVIGRNEALPTVNHNEVRVKGIEAATEYTKRFGELKVSIGGNLTYAIVENVKPNETLYPSDTHNGLIRKGTQVGSIFGYKYIGTFKDQPDINDSPLQLTGNVRPGDLKYEDANKDGIVDDRDQKIIGNSDPKLFYGVSVRLNYKGFNLDAYGIGCGIYNRLLNNSYYQIYGDRKYSDVVVNGLPNGNPHPQLTTAYIDNNFVNSSYWIGDGSYFKLRNVEIGYTLSQKAIQPFRLSGLKLFARGFNLFTISQIKDLDPESLSAGISNFPLATTITGGAIISF